MKSKFLKLALFPLLAATASACGVPEAGDEEGVAVRQDELWLKNPVTLWPHTTSTSESSIFVCFDTTAQQVFSAAQRSAMRQLVEENWERAAFIDFFGWGACAVPAPTSNAIIVKVNPNFGPTLGRTSPNNIVGKNTAGANVIEFLTTTPTAHTVLNLFGRTLGFVDETADNSCMQRTTGGTSLEFQGDAALSVMSGLTCSNSSALSAWDILGVRAAYGQKRAGTIAGLGGLSLNIQGGSTNLGALIVGYPATGGKNDTWLRGLPQQPNGFLQTNLGTTANPINRCINIQGGAVSQGFTPLISWSCDPQATNESFRFTDVQWLAMGNMCVAAESAASGSKLSTAVCNSASSLQKWTFFDGANKITLSGTNLCVTNANLNIGTELTLATCGSVINDFFFFGNQGEINTQSLGSNRCFNVLGGTTTPGARIALWDGCNSGSLNEKFTIRGPIRAMGQCVNMFGGVPVDQVGIGMFPCQGGLPNELWEVFW